MSRLDARLEGLSRGLARRTGRRSFLARIGTLLAGSAALPLLPVALLAGRAAAARVWLRACVQLGHLWALAGLSYEEYAARRRPGSGPPSPGA